MLQLNDDVYHDKIKNIEAWCKKQYGDKYKNPKLMNEFDDKLSDRLIDNISPI